jgi:hypothetical protein
MAFHRKWFRWRAVRNDDGYEVAFVGGGYMRGFEIRYSGREGSRTVIGETARVSTSGGKFKRGLHLALEDHSLAKWDDGSETTAEEREAIRTRIHASLEYMGIPHTMDLH